MKTLILAAALLSLAPGMDAKINAPKVATVNFDEPKWTRSETGSWMGAHKTWYKLNTKDGTIWMSADGKTWNAAKDMMWQDKNGKWLKIADQDLKWSADGGKTWLTVPEWKWEGTDGKWYKFDKDWSLLTA